MKKARVYFAIFMAVIMFFGTVWIPCLALDSYANCIPKIKRTSSEEGEKADNTVKDRAKVTAKIIKDGAAEKGKMVTEKGKETAKKGKDVATKKGREAVSRAKNWYSNIDKEKFKKGWERAADFASAEVATNISTKYINSVSSAIEKFGRTINASKGSARGVAQEAGYIAEKWTTESFNIDAVAGSSKSRAFTPESNKMGSADIVTNFGEEVSLKYYKTATESANAQATTIIKKYNEYVSSTDNPMSLRDYLDKNGYEKADQDLLEGIYSGQARIIPSDQYDDAVKYLKERITSLDKHKVKTSSSLSNTYKETLDSLCDRLKDPKGTQSRPATKEEMEAVAELAMKGDFRPEDFGFTLSQVITPKYIIKQSINTGEKTAALNIALTLGPEIYLVIAKAIKTGEINKEDFEKMGADAITSGTEGFIEGSVSSAILLACKTGKFGSQFTNVQPDVVAALTVITIDSIRYGYALSKGKITPAQYSDLMAEEIVSMAGSMSVAGLALLLGGSKIAILAGCMAGGMLASIGYNMGKEAVLEIRDAGGFAAIVPANSIKGILIDSEEIAALKWNNAISFLKGMKISTLADGKIKVCTDS